MAKQTKAEKLVSLTEKLEKAKKSREKIDKAIKKLNEEIEAIRNEERNAVAKDILGNKENLDNLLSLGIINQDQYNALLK